MKLSTKTQESKIEPPDEPWALLLDVEGTKNLSLEGEKGDVTATVFLAKLTTMIFRVGTARGRDYSTRIFAHQFGDAFLIAPEYGDRNYTSAVSIGIGIMRALVKNGIFVRAALSFGNISDQVGCLEREVLAAQNKENPYRIDMGKGLMTINPVYGPGLSRAYGVSTRKPKGPRFVVDPLIANRLTETYALINRGDVQEINWVQTSGPEIDAVVRACHLEPPDTHLVGKVLRQAVESAKAKDRELPYTDQLLRDLLGG